MNDYDPHAAQELLLWIKNDGDLYRQRYSPINKNLTIKKAQGKYDHDKAAKLFGYLVEAGAKRYDEEVNGAKKYHGRIPPYFTKKVREAVAQELRDEFEDEWALGNYSEYVPMKYRAQPKKKVVKKRATRTRTATSLGGVR